MPIKMYCIYSRESIHAMEHNRGKMAAQAGHAYLGAWWEGQDVLNHFIDLMESSEQEFYEAEWKRLSNVRDEYQNGDDARKICLVVDTTDELRELVESYKGFTGTMLVEDCGYTIVEPGTITCAGIGPLRDEEKGGDLLNLELLV